MPKKLFRFFSSVKLAVFIFIFSMILIVIGTVDQRTHGIFYIMDKYFYTWFVFTEEGTLFFLGGYFWGWALFTNLICGTLRYIPFKRSKLGILIIHAGMLMLLLGTFITSISQIETRMSIREGEKKNYSESQYKHELAFVPINSKDGKALVTIPEKNLKQKILIENLTPLDGLSIKIKAYHRNSNLTDVKNSPYNITKGIAKNFNIITVPYDTSEKTKSFPSIIATISFKNQLIGTYLFSAWLNEQDIIKIGEQEFKVYLRNKRYYLPFSIELVDFSFDRYRGTDTPRNYSSQVILHDDNQKQETLIYMNTPLRKAGKTFYQASFFRDEKGTILQVVENKGWLIPYISTIIISLGMIWQFLSHLIKFLNKRNKDA